MKLPKLIRCGDHKWTPRQGICFHIKRKKAQEYVRIKHPDGTMPDAFICRACSDRLRSEKTGDITVISVCMHCVRRLTRRLTQIAELYHGDQREEEE